MDLRECPAMGRAHPTQGGGVMSQAVDQWPARPVKVMAVDVAQGYEWPVIHTSKTRLFAPLVPRWVSRHHDARTFRLLLKTP